MTFCNLDDCENGILDDTETDIDCGGACEKCSSGFYCLTDDDCSSGICENGICINYEDKDTDGKTHGFNFKGLTWVEIRELTR